LTDAITTRFKPPSKKPALFNNPWNGSVRAQLAEWLKEATQVMVSVVVSIQMRKIFVQVRKMFSNAPDAEQDVREREASRNF
jgi:hypothetical protein